MSAAEAARRAIAQAEAEGLELLRSDNTTGFLGVVKNKPGKPKPYQARLWRNGKDQNLGRGRSNHDGGGGPSRRR